MKLFELLPKIGVELLVSIIYKRDFIGTFKNNDEQLIDYIYCDVDLILPTTIPMSEDLGFVIYIS